MSLWNTLAIAVRALRRNGMRTALTALGMIIGVAAVIVSESGKRDKKMGGLELQPRKTEKILRETAREHPCPEPRLTEFGALYEGGPEYNGFYGFGIVDALSATTAEDDDDD